MSKFPLFSQTHKRIFICAIVLLAYASGAHESMADANQVLFVKSTVRFPQNDAHYASASATLPSTQIKEMNIGVEFKAEPTPTTPSPSRPPGWGTAKQLDEHTWTMDVGQDATMATAGEIFSSLNAYRQKHGRGVLTWSESLAQYAQSRTDYFLSIHNLDSHKGFREYLDQNGFEKLGFAGLGENSSLGFKLEATHLIEWVYAGDSQHNDNQLNSQWTAVGIGVSGTATNLIFGGKKL